MKNITKKLLGTIILYCLFMPFSYLHAVEFIPLDSIAISTGGAGVASASSSFASYYNPALLPYHLSGFEWVTSVGVGIREFNLADHIDKLYNVDIRETLNDIEAECQSIAWTPGMTSYRLTKDSISENTKIIKNELGLISDRNGVQVMPNVSIGFQFGNLGIGLFNISELTAVAAIDDTKLNFIVKSETSSLTTPYLYFKYDEDDNEITRATEHEYYQSSLESAIDDGSTHLKLKGISYYEIPIAYGHRFSTPIGNISVGGAVKVMPGYTYEKVIKVDTDSGDILDEFDDGSEHQDTTFGFDLGFLYSPKILSHRLIAGMVYKNINSPKFESKSGFEYTIDPQIRAGLLFHIIKDSLMLSMDYDFTENESILNRYTSQNIGGGIHFKAWNIFSLRCGAQKNMKSNEFSDEGTIFTAGFSLGLKWFKIDLSGQYSTETTEFDGNEIPSSGRVQVSLVSNLFYSDKNASKSQYQDIDQRDVVQDAVHDDEENDAEDTPSEVEFNEKDEMPGDTMNQNVEEDFYGEMPQQNDDNIETAVVSPIEEPEPTEIEEPEPTESAESAMMTPPVETQQPEKSEESEQSEPIDISNTVIPQKMKTQSNCPNENIQVKMQETINITTSLEKWSTSWSQMDINKYFAMYSPNFEPSNGLSFSDWKTKREKRFKKKYIKVEISNVSIDFTACKNAKVVFDQNYESPGYSDQTKKMLLLEKIDSQWLIQKEGVVQ